MTLQTTKPTQMRLDSRAWALPKWPKIHGKRRRHARPALKTSRFAEENIASVANTPENAQAK